MKKYKHFISLGYFCSVALELERIGLRNCSSPFDWCITEWKGVEKALTTRFQNFLKYENLYQNKMELSHYKDMEYGMAFFHDFNQYVPLKEQLPSVYEKYKKRIERFFQNIKEPTLFIRYISNEKGFEEIDYLEQNYDKILGLLKSFHQDNDIIFIANNEVVSKCEKIKIYFVSSDEGDVVARKPLEKNRELDLFLRRIEYDGRQRNVERYMEKQKKENFIFTKYRKKVKKQLQKIFCKPYIHKKQY